MSGATNKKETSPAAKLEYLYSSPSSHHNVHITNGWNRNNPRSQQTSLLHLPDELILKIFELCGPATSACLGLTSKRFYPIYQSQYASVSIGACVMVESEPRFLYQLLSEWMGSDYVLVFHPKLMRVFVKRELAARQLENGDLVECTLANWKSPSVGSSSGQQRR
jgi:hypothetical protein